MTILERRRRDDPRRQRTEDAFVAAAESLLQEGHAFAELSVSLVATRAGRTRTAFYAHFDDRRALLLRLMEPLERDVRASLAPFYDGTSNDDVRPALLNLLTTCRSHAHVLRATGEAAAYDDVVRAAWSQMVSQFTESNRRRLERAGMDPSAASSIAVALTLMTERACTQHLAPEGTGLDDDDLVGALDAVWSAVLGSLPAAPG